MQTKNWKATITTAYGKPVVPALKIAGTYSKFETQEEVEKAYAKPGEFVKFVCASATAADKATTVAEARTAALKNAGIEAPKMSESRELQVRSIMAGLVAAGRSETEARKIAEDLVPAKEGDESSEESDE